VNDYRNIVVAEAMKVLGFVNRHSRGVLRVQKELVANENGEAIYDFGYQTAVMVCEKKSPLGERMTAAAIANGFLLENGEIRSNSTILDGKQPQKGSKKPSKKPSKKWSKMKVSVFPSKIVEDVFKALKLNPKAKYSWLVDNLGVSESTVLRAINDLKELGYINSEHSKVKGVWQLLK
jgi:ATP-dependent DNA helicase RecG